MRTLDDSLGLRAEILDGGRRVVVIGAGFIGLEVAATARQLGNDVIVLEGAEAPLIRGLGAEMGAAIGALHVAEGIDLRCGVRVRELTAAGVTIEVDGEVEQIAADVVVVGIGVVPATGWLEGSGLQLAEGVVCDATLNARTSDGSLVPGVYAAGDVLRWHHPGYGEEIRVEHWTNAAEQGARAAENLLAVAVGEQPEEYAPVPFFWSDQFAHRIQFLGRAGVDDDVVVAAGSVEDGKGLALYGRDGMVRGALGVNAPRWLMPMRMKLLDGISMDDALAHAAEL